MKISDRKSENLDQPALKVPAKIIQYSQIQGLDPSSEFDNHSNLGLRGSDSPTFGSLHNRMRSLYNSENDIRGIQWDRRYVRIYGCEDISVKGLSGVPGEGPRRFPDFSTGEHPQCVCHLAIFGQRQGVHVSSCSKLKQPKHTHSGKSGILEGSFKIPSNLWNMVKKWLLILTN